MNTPEFQPNESDLELIASQEAESRSRLLQSVTSTFRDAERLDQANSDAYIQRSLVEAPVPTYIARLDAKDESIVQTLTGQKMSREKIFVYIPQEDRSSEWFTRAWFKRRGPDGVEGMFQLDQHGYAPYESHYDIEQKLAQVEQEVEDETGETDLLLIGDRLVIDAMKAKIRSRREMENLLRQLREDFNIVPFYS